MAKNPIQEAIKAGKTGQAMKLELKRQALAARRTGGAPNIMSIMSVFSKARKNAPDREDDSDPTPDPTPDPPLPPAKPISNNWEDIVGHYFPKKTMKDGGLVRGGGVAQRGKGRGKMC